jgi:hypothetical protein
MRPRLPRLWTLLAVATGLCATGAQQTNRLLADVPIQTEFGGMAFFPGTVNSIPLEFLLDTGGGGSSLAPEVANQLGVKLQPGRASVAGNSALEVGVVPGATITVGSAVHNAENLMVAPLAPLKPIFGRQIDGILGGDWIQQYVVELDFETSRMRLFDPKDFKYTGGGQSLPLAVVHSIPFVDLNVTLPNGKSLWGHFLVDSGGGGMAVHIYSSIVARNGLAAGLKLIEETGQGIGGATRRFALRGAEIELGKYRLKKPVVVITPSEAGLRADPVSSGLVGMDVLQRFKITFDYSRGRMYLEPNRRLHDPFVYDTTGMGLRAAPPDFSTFTISRVKDASPAKEAGLQPGDQLLQIDGQDLAVMRLEAVRMTLRPPGHTHKLKILRDGQTMDVVLRTRETLP